ncbi:uncharacterized protein CANTADRAFT_170090 [Suhomyces tanzawaensis NRRL Y-17324]|uniref:C2H2-type domain-containing protein n=1 Tax=Suhomyces tanzawaensis NRRL Y-17324 TaxID=984487 RepID=A0A1E4SMI1_9ASCO|nr:uncharacterized protein CANTADRAFT_170090 [Suhomyces tanzawaensis NRRL Y-17324]ODV80720.1 hypothetical protein CANTADRAFT_170090 [Suhomyces tanzawaensis NRRL Y-17324]
MFEEPKQEDESPNSQVRKHSLEEPDHVDETTKKIKADSTEIITNNSPKSEDRSPSPPNSDKETNGERNESRPNSPKDYKNLSINLILNVKGGASTQQSEGANSLQSPISNWTSSNGGSLHKGSDTTSTIISPISPKLLNSKAPGTSKSRLSSQSNPTDQRSSVGSNQGAEDPQSKAYPLPAPEANHPQALQVGPRKAGELTTQNAPFPSNAPFGYSNVAGAHLYSAPVQAQPGMAAGQPMLGTGAQLHHLDFQQLQHQTHQGQDIDLLHESKRGRRFRRRYNQIIRRYSCSYPGCSKSYGSLNHLNTHIVTKKHGHRKSKADFQHNQFPNGEQENAIAQGSLYGEHTPYSPQAPPMISSEYPGNYWYSYRPQGVSQPPTVAGQPGHIPPQLHLIAPHVHSGPGLPHHPPPPPQVSGMGYYYYPPGYQQHPVPPSHGQQGAGVGWPAQQPVYPLYPHNPVPYPLAPGSSASQPPPLSTSQLPPAAPQDRQKEDSEGSNLAGK